MKELDNMDDITKVIYAELVKQSELDRKRVLNGLSYQGQDLQNILNKYEVDTITQKNDLLLFSITATKTTNDISQMENDKIYQANSFVCSITIYGDDAFDIADTLEARLLTMKVRQDLLTNGIHIVDIANMTDTYSFLNETLWHQTVLQFRFSVKHHVSLVEDDYEMKNMKTINVSSN